MSDESAVAEKKMLSFILKSSDGHCFTVQEDIAFQSNLLRKMASNLSIDPDSAMLKEAIPVNKVDSWTLEKIIAWCTTHRGEIYKPREAHEDPRIKLTPEDEEYLNVSASQLSKMLLGANYLDVPGLFEIITQKIANMAIGKSVEEIREIYGLVNDYTPEEEKELRDRFEWIQD